MIKHPVSGGQALMTGTELLFAWHAHRPESLCRKRGCCSLGSSGPSGPPPPVPGTHPSSAISWHPLHTPSDLLPTARAVACNAEWPGRCAGTADALPRRCVPENGEDIGRAGRTDASMEVHLNTIA
jgi:hypothetical protein